MRPFGASVLAGLLGLTTAAFAADGLSLPAGVLAFQEKVGGQMDIFVSEDGGRTGRNVSNHSAEDSCPSLSPDGHIVAFQSGRTGKSHLFTVSVKGGSPQQLTTGPSIDQSPCWSPDGRTIYFDSNRGNGWNLCSVASAGGPVRVITGPGFDALSPACSPDGTRLACQLRKRGAEAWTVGLLDLQGNVLCEASAAGSQFNETPSFSPDGKWLYFAASVPGGYELCKVASTGQGPVQALSNFAGWKLHPVAAAAGSLLLFDERTSAGWRLGLLAPGSAAHTTLPSAAERYHPSWRDLGR